jgi:2'-5' RNA ligase
VGFASDTFVVLDLSPEAERHVRDIRRRYGSARQYLPAEVTVAGSSGVGVFAPEQDPAAALETVAGIARRTAPFPMSFGPVARFPDSDVFYWAIRDVTPVVHVHERLRDSGLLFTPTPFPFSPHLTVDVFEAPAAELVTELLALAPPPDVAAATMTVYSLEGWILKRVARYPLEG